jgi:hypothetical protein
MDWGVMASRIAILVTCLLLVPVGTVFSYNSNSVLSVLDKNHDLKIERSEWPRQEPSFFIHDLNADGVISDAEISLLKGNFRFKGAFEKMDQNGDGVIVSHEWSGPRLIFVRLDQNGNRALSKKEFTVPKKQGGMPIADVFRLQDRDGNGVLSKDEWTESRLGFRSADVNGDGLISRDEYFGAGNGIYGALRLLQQAEEGNQHE